MTRALVKKTELQKLGEDWVKLLKRFVQTAERAQQIQQDATEAKEEVEILRLELVTLQGDLNAKAFLSSDSLGTVRALELSDGRLILLMKDYIPQLLEVVS